MRCLHKKTDEDEKSSKETMHIIYLD